MVQQLVLQDFNSVNIKHKAGDIFDDTGINLVSLRAAGLSFVEFDPAMQPAIDATLGQRPKNRFAQSEIAIELLARGQFPLPSSVQLLSGVVFIEQGSDFPTPVAQVITLADFTAYVINGAVDIGTDRLQVGAQTVVIGFTGPSRDSITYTGTGAMFTDTGINPFSVKNLTVTADSGSLFDVQGTPSELTLRSLRGSAGSGGTIAGTDVVMVDLELTGLDSGFTFATGGARLEMEVVTLVQAAGTPGTLIDLGTNVWTLFIRMQSVDLITVAGGTGLSGDTDNGNLGAGAFATMAGGLFSGSGTNLVGITVDDVRWLISGLGIAGSLVLGRYGFSGNATATVSPVTFTRVAGTTVATSERRVTHLPATNQMRADIITPVPFLINATVECTKTGGSGVQFSFAIFKTPNGGSAAQVGPEFGLEVTNRGNTISFTIVDDTTTLLDVYELRVINDDNTDNITVINQAVVFTAL